mgnify:CR=1 FL=1
MVKEYEIKVKVSDDVFNNVRSALIKLGGIFKGKVVEDDYYVDLRKCSGVDDVVFRIRIKDVYGIKKGELTIKGPKQVNRSVRIRDELSIELNNAEELVRMLGNMGFKIIHLRKEREEYSLNGLNLFLDKVMCLGKYIEVEILSMDEENDATAKLHEVMSVLGITGESISKSYLELMQEVGGRCEES